MNDEELEKIIKNAWYNGYDAAQPNWVEVVDDGKPDEGTYLVMVKDLGVTVGQRFTGRKSFWYILYPGALGAGEPIDYNGAPTHWMPLPEPPKEEE